MIWISAAALLTAIYLLVLGFATGSDWPIAWSLCADAVSLAVLRYDVRKRRTRCD